MQYLRIFVPNRKSNLPLFIAIHSLVWVITIFYLFATFFAIFECSPREKIWITEMDGKCFNQNEAYQSSGLFNVISDFVILVLPWASIWKLKLPLKKKLLIIAMFATGVLWVFLLLASWLLQSKSSFVVSQGRQSHINHLVIYTVLVQHLYFVHTTPTGLHSHQTPVTTSSSWDSGYGPKWPPESSSAAFQSCLGSFSILVPNSSGSSPLVLDFPWTNVSQSRRTSKSRQGSRSNSADRLAKTAAVAQKLGAVQLIHGLNIEGTIFRWTSMMYQSETLFVSGFMRRRRCTLREGMVWSLITSPREQEMNN